MTQEQREYIMKNSAKHTIKEMEIKFGLTRNVIHHMMKYYDLPYIKRVRATVEKEYFEDRCHITGFPLDTRIKNWI